MIQRQNMMYVIRTIKLMNLQRYCLFFIALCVLGMVQTSFAEGLREHVYDIPKVDDCAVTGEATSWKDHAFKIELLADPNGKYKKPSDFDPKVRLAWCDKGLLVYVTVQDDQFEEAENKRRMFEGDAVELFIGTKRGEHDYYMLVLGPGVTPQFPELRHIFFDERGGGPVVAEILDPLRLEVKRSKLDKGYAIEVCLPWTNLQLQPKPDLSLAFQVYAMDKDPGEDVFCATWYPANDTHLNQTTSMHLLNLTDHASSDSKSVIAGRFNELNIALDSTLIGKTIKVIREGETIHEESVKEADGRGKFTVRLPIPLNGEKIGDLNVYIDGQWVGCTERGKPESMLKFAMDEGELDFYQYVFSGDQFPKVEFKHPDIVRSLVGEYQVKPHFYDKAFNEVTVAQHPGKYASVVEIQTQFGRTTRRFFSLYRTTDQGKVPMLKLPVWLMPKVSEIVLQDGLTLDLPEVEGEADQYSEDDAVLRTYAYEQNGKLSDTELDDARVNDQAWWVHQKREIYGHSSTPVLPLPKRYDTQVGRTIEHGTPEQAGINPDVIKLLDEICDQWAKSNDGKGATICVVRHGIIFYYKSHGKTLDGKDMSPEVPGPMYSLTKLITGVMLGMYVDQGLIDLDAPIDRTIPTVRGIDVNVPMTHRMLMTHTSGLEGHYGDELRDLEERIAEEYAYDKVPVDFKYCGLGFALTVKALELISDEPYPNLYRKLLLDPLEMNHTVCKNSHNGGIGIAIDVAKVGQMLLNKGTYGHYRFMSEQTVNAIKPNPLTPIFGDETEKIWGIGFWGPGSQRAFEEGAYGHGSANSSYMRIDPKHDLVIAVSSLEKRQYFNGTLRNKFVEAILTHIVDESEVATK